jgi:hypothetical protein
MTATKAPTKAKTKAKAKKSTKKKLTLSLNQEVIEQGKFFAKEQGVSLSKLFELFLKEQISPTREPIMVVEPDADILALMGKPIVPLKSKTNYEYYDEYYESRRARYLESAKNEEE